MKETDFSPRPNATDPDTDELADIAERAESGDDAADLAIQEAGGPRASPDEAPQEAVEEVDREGEPVPASDVTDVPSEEGTLDESEAEQELPEDVIEGEDEGPMFGSGPDDYVAPEAEAEPEAVEPVAEAPETAAEPQVDAVEMAVEAEASEEAPAEALPAAEHAAE